jgi:methylenetetrahydrofolate--tRNA-(uracil-5-)-methyltransferase
LAELVCSNSFRSDDPEHNAVGLLHEEMRRCGSLILRAADKAQSAGRRRARRRSRRLFAGVEAALEAEKLVEIGARRSPACRRPSGLGHRRDRAADFAPPLAEAILKLTGEDSLAFFDAIAPIVTRTRSISRRPGSSRATTSRAPAAPAAGLHQLPDGQGAVRSLHRRAAGRREDQLQGVGGNTPYFEGCLPIEVMAERGRDTLRLGR